jgi:hypothetical protein
MQKMMLFDPLLQDWLIQHTGCDIIKVFCPWLSAPAIGLRLPEIKDSEPAEGLEIYFRPFDIHELRGHQLAFIEGRRLTCTPAFRSAWIESGHTGLNFNPMHGPS